MRATLIAFLFVFLTTRAVGADPSLAISRAREHLRHGEFNAAILVLQSAVPEATQIAGDLEKSQALAAIHFYSALSFHGLGDEAKAREQLQEFFRFSSLNTIDPNKYDAQFVTLFHQVRGLSEREGQRTTFDQLYPGFRSLSTESPKERRRTGWEGTPEFAVLATAEEKSDWKRLRDEDGLARFLQQFWAQRDPNPETAINEFRQTFESRVVFADYTFGTEELRGSLSDRGKVFVLLGKPSIVRTANVTRGQDITIPASSPLGIRGSVERWTYFGEQVPSKVPKREVTFTFITQEGYGNSVMQRDFFPVKTLAEAAKPGAFPFIK